MSQATPFTDEVKSRSGWSIFMGVLIVALGGFLIVYPLFAGVVTTVLLGWTLVFAGIAELVFAFDSTTPGSFFLKALIAVLWGVSGILLAAFPLTGMASLTAIVGSLFILRAVLLGVLAFKVRPAVGWGSYLFDALLTALTGGLILWSWPSSSTWAIGTLVGVAILMRGMARIVIASGIRKGASEVQQFMRTSS